MKGLFVFGQVFFALPVLVSACVSSDWLEDRACSCKYSTQHLEINSSVLLLSKLGLFCQSSVFKYLLIEIIFVV